MCLLALSTCLQVCRVISLINKKLLELCSFSGGETSVKFVFVRVCILKKLDTRYLRCLYEADESYMKLLSLCVLSLYLFPLVF